MSGLEFYYSLYEQQATSSDEEIPAEEEAEVLRLQREKAKSLSMEDFGLEDISPDEATVEPTLGVAFSDNLVFSVALFVLKCFSSRGVR